MMKVNQGTSMSDCAPGKLAKNLIDAAVGAQVRSRRNAIQITQGELGESLGLSWRDIDALESGAFRISLSQLVDLSRALSVPIDYLLAGLENGA